MKFSLRTLFTGTAAAGMPRYKLRTLLILLVICAAVFARIGYLRHRAIFHRHEVARLLPTIASAEGENGTKIFASIQTLAESGTAPIVLYDGPNGQVVGVADKDGLGRRIKDASKVDAWYEAVHHQILSDRYERAVYRPWLLVSESVAAP